MGGRVTEGNEEGGEGGDGEGGINEGERVRRTHTHIREERQAAGVGRNICFTLADTYFERTSENEGDVADFREKHKSAKYGAVELQLVRKRWNLRVRMLFIYLTTIALISSSQERTREQPTFSFSASAYLSSEGMQDALLAQVSSLRNWRNLVICILNAFCFRLSIDQYIFIIK